MSSGRYNAQRQLLYSRPFERLTRSKRTPAGKQATRSVSKSCHAAGFTLRYRREPPRRGLPHRTGSPTVIENDARYNIAV
ncbi:hypothetical protein [Nostoc sp.]|uniref:hypothetical protein n=1 Tax=Nostoc sp. TaxID=1180 RepID=UPI002FF6A453